MFSISTLGLMASLLGGPAEWADSAELGGSVVAEQAPKPLPAVVPITVRLYEGALPVATTQADLFGRYRVNAPPGEYWLQVMVGGTEAHVERVRLKEGSFTRDVPVEVPWQPQELPAVIARGGVRS